MKRLKTQSINFGVLAIALTMFVSLLSCDTKSQQKSPSADDKAPTMSIHEAAFMGNTEAIQAHINVKSDLNAKDAYGSSPLTIASLFNKPEVAGLLINAGADVNIKSADGSTPLHTASFFCRKEIVEMLLKNGADITAKNNYGSTALESVMAPFESVKPIYDQMSRDLGPMGLKLDYSYLEKTRPEIAEMIKNSR
ncbi:ankyrin repeat domain-containing protein [Fulvivirga sedimenti]|uniref:Ankyrin repeat domain-containing protein n=1 Tax=Fulvivirga sedimenti TaxID=2879465 RepID=A0A9X1HYI8_9BACT|nr:ankyrin repeat domain-containing protein [Fulvivirga sedimenti]MCA6078922.1 ankyrin repeat domain-containing protein [Fulvivirga sedimenti]